MFTSVEATAVGVAVVVASVACGGAAVDWQHRLVEHGSEECIVPRASQCQRPQESTDSLDNVALGV